MKKIVEIVGEEAYARLKERYGVLVDEIFVKEEETRIFKMKFQVFNWKKTSMVPAETEIERALGIGVAEIEYAIYHVLNIGGVTKEPGVRLDNNLDPDGIYMHPRTYAKLRGYEEEGMIRVEELLNR